MTNGSERYLFAGHAIGAAARFHRLDDAQNLNHVIPTLAASVLPATGGRSEATLSSYRYTVDEPRRRTLFAVDRVATWVEGRGGDSRNETELSVEVTGLEVVEKLRIDSVRLHLLSQRTPGAETTVLTNGSRIEGLRLGKVEARLALDEEPLQHTGSADRFAAWHDSRNMLLAQHGEYRCGTIVRAIDLVGEERDLADISVDRHVIRWKGFGRIILGEIHVKGHERRVTMVRLEMGSDAGGTATTSDTGSNGTLPGG